MRVSIGAPYVDAYALADGQAAVPWRADAGREASIAPSA